MFWVYIFTVYFYCISANLSFHGVFSVHFIFVSLNAFYALPFDVMNDDDDDGDDDDDDTVVCLSVSPSVCDAVYCW